VLTGACALTLSVPASAQEFLKGDRKITEGPGYQAGDFEIHPGLAAEVGYDSNYLTRSDKTGPTLLNGAPQAPPIESGELRISPSLSIRTQPSAQRAGGAPGGEQPAVTLSAGASGTYRELFAKDLQNQRNMSAAANVAVGILPGREWSGSVNATYTRTIQPSVQGNPDISYNNDVIAANADLATQPNMGTLSWHFGYTFTGTIFEQSDGTPYNNTLHTGYTRGRWRFRPRTALVYDGQVSLRSYGDASHASFILHQATPVRAKIGMEGLVTPRFSILGMIGYGATLTNGNAGDPSVQQYDSIIGNLELRFFPGSTPETQDAKPSLMVSTIALGYTRDFQASYLNDFYGIDRGYLSVEYFFAGRLVTTLNGGVGAYEYPDLYFGGANGVSTTTPILMAKSYTNVVANATLFVEYRVLQGVGINATGTYGETFSSTLLPSNPSTDVGGVKGYYDLNNRRFGAFLGVRWFM
jgi:hypothetical protein